MFGVSWQIVHVPVNDAGGVTPFGNICPFRPPTPDSTIGLLLNSAWPRTIDSRAAHAAASRPSLPRPARRDQGSKIVKTLVVNGAPVGFRPTGSLMPTKNCCRDT